MLVTADGKVCGVLPPVEVATPWWQDGEPVLKAVKDRFGLDIILLRLLTAERPEPHGGHVTYLAEVDAPIEAASWDGTLDEHSLRLPYARPGGPKAEIDWALAQLKRLAVNVNGKSAQVRSWNLSSIWRIPAEGQTIWLKSVPPFFAHEGKLLAAMQDQPVPRLLASGGGRSLLAEVPGEDLYEPEPAQRLAMVSILVDIQVKWAPRLGDLLKMGLPDWRAPALGPAINDVLSRTKQQLSKRNNATLQVFARELPARFAEMAACGIPYTLVHGDFHPGNFRGAGRSLTLLDWGDSGIGHPLLDQPAFMERAPANAIDDISRHWNRLLKKQWPASDPERASKLLAPIAAARQAVIYQMFLDNIEPSERVYHRNDPARWLNRAAAVLRAESSGPS